MTDNTNTDNRTSHENKQQANAEAVLNGDIETETMEMDRFGGIGLTQADLIELTPFSLFDLDDMADEQVAGIARETTVQYKTDGEREAYINAISAIYWSIDPDHPWTDPNELRLTVAEESRSLAELKRIAEMVEVFDGIPVTDYAERAIGPSTPTISTPLPRNAPVEPVPEDIADRLREHRKQAQQTPTVRPDGWDSR